MGYTHYWYTTRDFSNSEWSILSKLAQEVIHNNYSTIPVAGGFGQGEPEVNNEHIWLNGTVKNGMDHETFRMTKIRQGRPAYDDPDKEFNFCKTARKPYDLYCVHILSIAKAIAPDAIELSSDGGDEVFRQSLDHYCSKLARESTFYRQNCQSILNKTEVPDAP